MVAATAAKAYGVLAVGDELVVDGRGRTGRARYRNGGEGSERGREGGTDGRTDGLKDGATKDDGMQRLRRSCEKREQLGCR